MEGKIMTIEVEKMLKEFIFRSFLPNNIDDDFQDFFYKNLKKINKKLLLNDFKKLYEKRNSFKSFNESCKILIIKSKNDLILDPDSIDELIESLEKSHCKNATVIELRNQGHFLANVNLFKLILDFVDT